MSRVLGGSLGAGRFLMGEVPLYRGTSPRRVLRDKNALDSVSLVASQQAPHRERQRHYLS